MITHGKYSDGIILTSFPVRLEFTDDGRLLVQSPDLALSVSTKEIRFSDRLGNVPRFLYLPDGATIETRDNDTIDAFLALHRSAQGSHLIHILEKHSRIAAAATLLFIVVVSCTLYYGLPWMSFRLAQKVPPSVEKQIGRATLLAMSRHFSATGTHARDRKRVQSQLQRLLPDRADAAMPRLEFLSMPGSPNAFALPGDIIIVSDELINLATDDEIAAVLAHELGHLEKSHGLQSILRSSAALLVVTAVTGDLSTLTNFAGTLPFMLVNNGYSRSFEEEADQHAHDLMIARGIDLKHFSTLMRKLNAGQPQLGRALSYFSTHPATEDRLKLFPAPSEEREETPVGSAEKPDTSPLPKTPERTPAEEDGTFESQEAGNAAADPLTIELIEPEFTYRIISTDQKPVPRSFFRPNYPEDLRLAKVEGTVILDFIIDPDGNVSSIEVIRSTHIDFTSAAIRALEAWKFQPGVRDGKPVHIGARVPIEFKLGAQGQPLNWNKTDYHPPQTTEIKSSADTDFSTDPVQIIQQANTLGMPQLGYTADAATLRRINQQRASFHLEKAIYPKPIAQTPPVYPMSMRRANLGGEVMVDFVVDEEGHVQTAYAARSTHRGFEEAAVEAVQQWKFESPRKDGIPVAVRISVPIVFALNDYEAVKASLDKNPSGTVYPRDEPRARDLYPMADFIENLDIPAKELKSDVNDACKSDSPVIKESGTPNSEDGT